MPRVLSPGERRRRRARNLRALRVAALLAVLSCVLTVAACELLAAVMF